MSMTQGKQMLQSYFKKKSGSIGNASSLPLNTLLETINAQSKSSLIRKSLDTKMTKSKQTSLQLEGVTTSEKANQLFKEAPKYFVSPSPSQNSQQVFTGVTNSDMAPLFQKPVIPRLDLSKTQVI